MKKFKPVLFPNTAVKLEDMPQKDYIISRKLDGFRLIVKDGQLLSRTFKEIPNKQLQEKFSNIKQWSKDNNIILDGEIYSHELTFQDITRAVMTEDFTDEKTIKKLKKELQLNDITGYVNSLLSSIKFYCFDTFSPSNPNEPFLSRLNKIPKMDNLVIVHQQITSNKKYIQEVMEESLKQGYEGLMLRDPNSKYKFGRYTIKSGDGFKLKNYHTYDGQIVGYEQATIVNPDAEKKINELGFSETSKKKDDRIPVEMIGSWIVECDGIKQKVNYAVTHEQKKWAWKNREDLIGKWIEFQAMTEGMKDKLRIPTFIRWREDKQSITLP